MKMADSPGMLQIVYVFFPNFSLESDPMDRKCQSRMGPKDPVQYGTQSYDILPSNIIQKKVYWSVGHFFSIEVLYLINVFANKGHFYDSFATSRSIIVYKALLINSR